MLISNPSRLILDPPSRLCGRYEMTYLERYGNRNMTFLERYDNRNMTYLERYGNRNMTYLERYDNRNMTYLERYDNRNMTLTTDHLFNYTFNFASTPSCACTLRPLITPRDIFIFIFDFILSNLFVKAILMGSPSVSLPVQPSLCSQ